MKSTILCLALALWLMVPAAMGLELRDVRLWRAPDHTRIVFDLSAPVEHKLIVLENPRRIVVDMQDTRFRADISQLSFAGTPIKRVRHGVRQGVDLRVVFDLSGPVKPRSFILRANDQRGDRLVLDLYDSVGKPAAPSVKKSIADSARRDIVVAIDAGHGGEDPGASGPNKVREKDVVMAIARELYTLLKKEEGFTPQLIRTGDYYIGLKKRRELAREKQADLLISIHADAFSSPKAKGSSVYVLSQRGATSTFARFLAQRENAADLVGGVSLSDKDELLAEVLYDLSMTASLEVSLGLGKRVLGEMAGVAKIHSPRVEQASFAVLKSPDIPSVLVETGFISNPQEAYLLSTAKYQKSLGGAIHSGIKSWFYEHPPSDTLIAWRKQERGHEYTIARGDTLSQIAERFHVSVPHLRAHNALSGSSIRVGQKLIIPAS